VALVTNLIAAKALGFTVLLPVLNRANEAIEQQRRCCGARVDSWPKPAAAERAEHVRSARVLQTSICSAIARASSTSMPRYLTVLSILV
jgi:hypothetical protein